MPSPRCSFNVNGALLFVPSTWKAEEALVCGFEGAGVTGRGNDTAGLDGVAAGVFGLSLAGVLDSGNVVLFGLVLVTGLDLAFRDGDLIRLTVPALDLVFALLLVFAATLAFGTVFVFFLATMRASLLFRTTVSHVACRCRQNLKALSSCFEFQLETAYFSWWETPALNKVIKCRIVASM